MRTLALGLAAALALSACDLGRVTVGTTADVLARGQPALNMESDYGLAAAALPGVLKTIEGFWVVDPDNEVLISLLTEGFCQYGIGFVQDEWEVATFAKDLEAIDELDERATKIFTRCLNYALRSLGSAWQKDLFGATDRIEALARGTGHGKRTPLMWAAIALGSIVNHNLDNIEVIGQATTVRILLNRVLELDAAKLPSDPVLAALPHVALGQLESPPTTQSGNPQKAIEHFEKAIALTSKNGQERFLLPRVFMAYRVGRITRNRPFFHDNLAKVLDIAPSVWPEQRLANEIAQRRARRYLKLEKELFR